MSMMARDALELLALAFIVVGLPALILKLTTIWFVRSDADKPRLRLLALSIGGSSSAGIVTIVCYAVLSRLFEFPAPGTRYLPSLSVFIATVATLVGLVAAIELLLWRGFARNSRAQSNRTRAAWLVGGNAWILWAVWLMDQYRDMQQLSGID